MATNPLLDILSAGREVPVGRGKVTVVDVPLSFIGKMLARFPDLRAQIAGGNATFASALMMFPDALPMFLAAGIGKAGDPETEDIMGRLGSKAQLALLNEIIIETKGGETAGPLIDRIKALVATLGINPAVVDRLTEALAKIELEVTETSDYSPTISPPPSNASSDAGTKTSSNTRRAA